MEEYRTVIEAVVELLEKGYTIDFSALEDTFSGFKKPHSYNLAPDDFFIDEIYRCKEEGEDGLTESTFVFGISSHKYKLKGIAINVVKEDESTGPGLMYRIKHMFGSLKNWISGDKEASLN